MGALRNLTVLLSKVNRNKVLALPRARRKELFSGERRYCLLCQSSLRDFFAFGVNGRLGLRPNAWCPVCGSLERQRLIWMFLQQETDLFDPYPKTLLHVAPERVLEAKLKRVPTLAYLTADLDDPRAMVKMDITEIPFPDNSFDVILCSHVLEHVPDDRRAMRELNRVLEPDGWAVLLVPLTAEKTFEDPSITAPEERERLFDQRDHVRRYGPDFADRLREAGFRVRVYRPSDLADAQDIVRLGLGGTGREDIFLCESERLSESPEDRAARSRRLYRRLRESEHEIAALQNELSEERSRIERLERRNRRLASRARAQGEESSPPGLLWRGIDSLWRRLSGRVPPGG